MVVVPAEVASDILAHTHMFYRLQPVFLARYK